MGYEHLLPKIIGKKFHQKDFKPQKIFDSLRKETGISIKIAKEITDNVCKFLIASKLELITPPLIREIVNVELLRLGYEVERLKYTRIGFPRYDLKQMSIKYNGMTYFDMEFINKIVGGVITEFNDVEELIEERQNK